MVIGVGIDLQVFRPELLALADVDRVHAVRQREFLQHDRDLASVGRGPRVQIYHFAPSSLIKKCVSRES